MRKYDKKLKSKKEVLRLIDEEEKEMGTSNNDTYEK